jgi:hypothetical protein
MAFAEDVVKEEADLSECIFNLPQQFKELSQELMELLNKSTIARPPRSNIGNPPNKKD